jgi:hypothetical protein
MVYVVMLLLSPSRCYRHVGRRYATAGIEQTGPKGSQRVSWMRRKSVLVSPKSLACPLEDLVFAFPARRLVPDWLPIMISDRMARMVTR